MRKNLNPPFKKFEINLWRAVFDSFKAEVNLFEPN